MARKSRRSRRSRRRSRRSRGGKQLSKAEVKSIGKMAARTQKDALAAQSKASKAMQDAQALKARSLATVSDEGPPPISATFFPLFSSGTGIKEEISSL